MYSDESSGERLRWDEDDCGPPIIRIEIESGIRGMKSGNAAGDDGVFVEMIKAGGKTITDKITRLANIIYDKGYIHEAMEESVFVTILKKQRATN